MVRDRWPFPSHHSQLTGAAVLWSNATFIILIITLFLISANGQTYGYGRAGSSVGGGCTPTTSRSSTGSCTLALFCLLSGGQSSGSCANSLFYTCCVPRTIVIRENQSPSSPSRRQPAAAAAPMSYPISYSRAPDRQSANLVSSNNYPPSSSYTSPNAISSNNLSYQSFYQRIGYIVESCGKPVQKPASRIVGGQDAFYGEFPWQAHIKISRQQCGGALVSAYFVLTAAHCVYKAPLSDITIILGAYDIQDQRHQLYPAHYFRPVEKKIHPYFRFSPSHPDRYDVALLRLERAVHFQDHILPICLPPPNKEFQGWRALVTGWGKTDPALSGNRYGTRLLQKVDVPIIANDECERWHRTRGINLKIFPEMMCAGYEVGLKDACVGDSGGPLITYIEGRWTLVGVTSAGFGCAQSRQPGIYHRVPLTVDWIYSNIY